MEEEQQKQQRLGKYQSIGNKDTKEYRSAKATKADSQRVNHFKAPNLLPKIHPKQNCHKCGKRYWTENVEPFSWSCLYCGNLVYFTYGVFQQQIDIVMKSNRSGEFVYGKSGKTVTPVKDESLREIRFKKKLKDIEKTKKNKDKLEAGICTPE